MARTKAHPQGVPNGRRRQLSSLGLVPKAKARPPRRVPGLEGSVAGPRLAEAAEAEPGLEEAEPGLEDS
eukprot:1965187-Alexandrium_andersonii.AAC.1